MDISNLCRSCMKEVASWEKENFDARAVEMFCYCTNIKIMEDIKLPKQFCYDCTIKIESSYTFIKEAQNVNVTLKNIASRRETRIIIEPDSLKSHITEPNKLRLTLPDYKLSIGVSDYVEQDIFDDTDYRYNETALSTKEIHIASVKVAELSQSIELITNISVNSETKTENIINVDMPKRDDTIKFKRSNREISTNVEAKNETPIKSGAPDGDIKVDTAKRDVNIKVNTSKRSGIVKVDSSDGNTTIKVDETNKTVCTVCRKEFTSEKWFSKHMEKEHSGHKCTCTQCPKCISKRDVNIKVNTSKRSGIVKVDSSDGNTTIKVDETNKTVCPVCRKEFISKKWFSKHMEKEHSGHKYTCTQCPKSFSKPFQLAYHAACHSDEKKFVCNICGKSFKRRKQLTVHTRGHSEARPYACDTCHMSFKLKSVLKCHMKVHEDVKQYLCSYCGRGFSHAHNLEVHVRTHTGAKPYACSSCGFRAAAASSLRRHARTHSAARLYVCNHCRKAFTDNSGLARHTRTHTGELPYKCPGCARAFADSWKRKTHLMRAHRLALADIPRMRRDGQTLPP